ACSLLPTRPPPRSALFPYTTLFRSNLRQQGGRHLDKTDAAHIHSRRKPCHVANDPATQGHDHGLAIAMRRQHGVKNRIEGLPILDRKSTRLNSSHVKISYAVFCLKK